jgi:hypothetical protein
VELNFLGAPTFFETNSWQLSFHCSLCRLAKFGEHIDENISALRISSMKSIEDITPAIEACLQNAESLIVAAKASAAPGSYLGSSGCEEDMTVTPSTLAQMCLMTI